VDIFLYFRIYRYLSKLNKRVYSKCGCGDSLKDISELKPLVEMYCEVLEKSPQGVNTQNCVEAFFLKLKIRIAGGLRLSLIAAINVLHMTIPVFIMLGILGTFFGLTFSLSDMDVNAISKKPELLGPILKNMGTAFYTSLTGIGLSLVITILVKIFNPDHILTGIMSEVEKYLDNTLRAKKYMNDSNKFQASIMRLPEELLERFNNSIDKMSSRNEKNISDLKNGIHDVLEQSVSTFGSYIASIGTVITTGLEQAANKIDVSIRSMAKSTNASIDRMENNVTNSITKLADDNCMAIENMRENFNGAVYGLQETIESAHEFLQEFHIFSEEFRNATQYITSFNDKIDNSIDMFNNIYNHIEDFISRFSVSIEDFIKNLDTFDKSLPTISNIIKLGVEDNFKVIEAHADNFTKDTNRLIDKFDSIVSSNSDRALNGISSQFEIVKNQTVAEISAILFSFAESMTKSIADLKQNSVSLVDDVARQQRELVNGVNTQNSDIWNKYISSTDQFIIRLEEMTNKMKTGTKEDIQLLERL
jgi:archaellum component FlaC